MTMIHIALKVLVLAALLISKLHTKIWTRPMYAPLLFPTYIFLGPVMTRMSQSLDEGQSSDFFEARACMTICDS